MGQAKMRRGNRRGQPDPLRIFVREDEDEEAKGGEDEEDSDDDDDDEHNSAHTTKTTSPPPAAATTTTTSIDSTRTTTSVRPPSVTSTAATTTTAPPAAPQVTLTTRTTLSTSSTLNSVATTSVTFAPALPLNPFVPATSSSTPPLLISTTSPPPLISTASPVLISTATSPLLISTTTSPLLISTASSSTILAEQTQPVTSTVTATSAAETAAESAAQSAVSGDGLTGINDTEASADRKAVSGAGIAIGTVAGVAILVTLCVLLWKWRKRRSLSKGDDATGRPPSTGFLSRRATHKSDKRIMDNLMVAAYSAENGERDSFSEQMAADGSDLINEKSLPRPEEDELPILRPEATAKPRSRLSRSVSTWLKRQSTQMMNPMEARASIVTVAPDLRPLDLRSMSGWGSDDGMTEPGRIALPPLPPPPPNTVAQSDRDDRASEPSPTPENSKPSLSETDQAPPPPPPSTVAQSDRGDRASKPSPTPESSKPSSSETDQESASGLSNDPSASPSPAEPALASSTAVPPTVIANTSSGS
ncbi:hypothetical protein BJ170DRAFT_683226 [Xylariales sp. AK1849]|nr:hypothetical protein BJ170DRAFT_683226 [Xylariales sp. AK1849]